MNEMQLKEDFINKAKEIVKFCGKVSPEKCRDGKCAYSHSEYGCIFEAMGMQSPYDWDMEAGDDI